MTRNPALSSFSRFLRLAIRILLILLALGLVTGGELAYLCLTPYKAYSSPVFVEVEHGAPTTAVASTLEEQGVVRSRYLFLFLRLVQPHVRLQAGEYRFAESLSPWQVFGKIQRGDIYYMELRVPEGSDLFDIAGLLGRLDSVRPEKFRAAAADPSPISDLDPLAPDLEGYLFPSVYRVTRHTTGVELCRMMTSKFRKVWTSLAVNANSGQVHEAVTLASLVEKETAAAAERPLVASVFVNRLKQGMPLQCDPTVVYAALIEHRYRGSIYKSDLTSTNPYNTYTHSGLPPGPIANPGAESLKAALDPAQSDFLYFVAKRDAPGTHQFSTALADHHKAVAAYRKRGAQRKKE
jgi:UPF0755 protein